MPLTKQRKKALSVAGLNQPKPLLEALKLLKEISYTRFDASVDVSLRLGVDSRKSDQMLRATVNLPHGTGKKRSVLVLCNEDKVEEAKAAGADQVGLETYIEKIEKGWTEVDVIVTQPSLMARVS